MSSIATSRILNTLSDPRRAWRRFRNSRLGRTIKPHKAFIHFARTQEVGVYLHHPYTTIRDSSPVSLSLFTFSKCIIFSCTCVTFDTAHFLFGQTGWVFYAFCSASLWEMVGQLLYTFPLCLVINLILIIHPTLSCIR